MARCSSRLAGQAHAGNGFGREVGAVARVAGLLEVAELPADAAVAVHGDRRLGGLGRGDQPLEAGPVKLAKRPMVLRRP